MASLMNLPEDMLEEIFSRMPPQDSASLSQAHPVFRRLYRRCITADLQAAESWEEFAAVVDEVLDNHSGGALERLSIRIREKYAVEQHILNTAVSRWMDKADLYSVSVLELYDNNNTKIEFNFTAWQALRDVHLEWIHFHQVRMVLQLLLPRLHNLQRLNLQTVTIDSKTDLGWFLVVCPNLREFILHSCSGDGAVTISCPLLKILDIYDVVQWSVTINNLPFLTHFHVRSRDLPHFRLLQHPVSMVPIPPSRQDVVANVQSLFITVEDTLPITIRFIQYFHHSLRHLHLTWYVLANVEYQVNNTQELEELNTITIGGKAMYDEPLRVIVEYILAHSPSLCRFTLVVPRHLDSHIPEDNYLFEIEHNIRELPKSSQQAQFEFSWSYN